MSIETGLFTHLTTDANVSAIVDARVYPLRLMQGYTLPALTYQRISTERKPTLSGPNERVVGRFQINCFAATYSAARALADKVRISLDGRKGTLGSEDDVGGISIQGEWEDDDQQTDVYRIMLDFRIPYTELNINNIGD